MSFDGDWLSEVDHPWADEPRAVSAPAASRPTGPVPRRPLAISVGAVVLILAALAAILISERAAADQQPIPPATAHLVARKAAPAYVAVRKAAAAAAPVAEDIAVPGIPAPVLLDYRRSATRFHLDWRLLAAIGYNESDHGKSQLPGVHSPAPGGCCGGIMEVCISASCGDAGDTYGIDGNGDGVISMFEDADAVATAANILSSLRKEVGPDPRLLLAAYNAGVGAVLEHHGVPDYPETEAYVKNGMSTINSLPPSPTSASPRPANQLGTGGIGTD